jgi:hypothetical protein
MINFNEEYFSNNCYFFLKEREDKISLYYSVADTLTESRKKDDKKDFKKKDLKKVKNIVNKFLSSKEKVTKKDIDKELSNVSSYKNTVFKHGITSQKNNGPNGNNDKNI